MTQLDTWLKQATRQLSKESAAQVRREIGEHYEASRDAALMSGVNAAEADNVAVLALGDAGAANCQYRKVLLTKSEARLMRTSQWECRAIGRRMWLLSIGSLAAFGGAVALFHVGDPSLGWALIAAAALKAILGATPYLPVFTPAGGRIFRAVKWMLLAVMMTLALLSSPWLMFVCAWPVAWTEWQRARIRRKLPIAQWPKQLYL